MAKQRITNVVIDYNVRTVDLEKGNALLNRVNQSTDKLREATNNFGQSAGKSFQSASKHIEGMEIELARLRQQIKLTSTQDTARLQMLSTQYKNLKTQVDSYNKSLFETAAASKQTAQATQNMASQFGQVYTAAKLFITAGIAREVVSMSIEMAKLSGNVEGVARAFENQIPGAQAVLLRLRSATQGAVTDLELMQKALQAKNFGIDVQRLPELLEFAAIRAQQTGVSVDYLVNSIVTGIGRKSLLILDNLGISATRLKAEFNGAALAAQTVGEVTNGVANIIQEEMQKMGGYVATSATQVDQLSTSWHELRVEVAKFMTEGPTGGVVGFLKDYVDSFKALIESYNRGIPVSEVFAEKQRMIVAEMTVNEFLQRRLTKDKQENIKIIEEEIGVLTTQLGVYAKQRDATQKTIDFLAKEFYERRGNQYVIRENIELIEKGLKVKTQDALIDQATLKLLQDRLAALKAVNKEETTGTDGGKRTAPELKQTVNLDLKHPVTGEVLKYDRDNIIKAFNDMANLLPAGSITPIVQPVEITPMDGWDKIGKEFADRWKEVVSAGIQDTTTIINSFVEQRADSYDVELAKLTAFYDEQAKLAGDNERYKSALAIKREREEQVLRKKAFEADKEAKRLQTIINGAAGVINAFATLPYPAAIVASVLLAGTTAAQLAVINNQQYKGFAKGVIDLKGGKPGRDSIPSLLMPGESVMTTEETKNSKGIFRAVRAKKLNDQVMKEFISGRSGGSKSMVFDDSRILKKLDEVKNATPDLERRNNLLYEARKKGDGYKMWIRSKSMNS